MLIVNVDDDGDDREFFGEAINVIDPNTHCVLFENGGELLHYLGNGKTFPDFIFIDINMPKMNGYDCAQEIKLNDQFGETQIVMYSTAFSPLDLLKFDQEGFRHIVKQNTLIELVRSIQAVISLPMARQEEKRER